MIGAVAQVVRPFGRVGQRPPGSASSRLRYLWPTLHEQRGRLLEVAGYMLLNLSYGVVLPLSSKYLIDSVIPSGSALGLVVFVGSVFGIFVLNAAIGMRRAYVTALITQRVSVTLSTAIFSHLQRLSHAFYAERRVGEIVARLSGDLLVIEQAVAQTVGVALFLALTAAVSATAVIALSPTLGLLLLLIVPLFALAYISLRSRLQRASFLMQDQGVWPGAVGNRRSSAPGDWTGRDRGALDADRRAVRNQHGQRHDGRAAAGAWRGRLSRHAAAPDAGHTRRVHRPAIGAVSAHRGAVQRGGDHAQGGRRAGAFERTAGRAR
jgi:hypothetical protein